MKKYMMSMVLAAALVVTGCGGSQFTDAQMAELEEELALQLEGRDLGRVITGVETGAGGRVRVLTQLHPDETEAADAICNNTTVAASGLDDIEVSGVDVAAAGGRNIAHCEPKV